MDNHGSAPPLVKFFVAILLSPEASEHLVHEALIANFEAIDYQGQKRPFDMTNYYLPEMGPNLERYMIGFTKLRSPEDLVEAKWKTIEIEQSFAVAGKRVVNLDIGYLDYTKVVLASTKEAGQKIYLNRGIYADMIVHYASGRYHPFEWTFPDFKDGRYDDELLILRNHYKKSRKRLARAEVPQALRPSLELSWR